MSRRLLLLLGRADDVASSSVSSCFLFLPISIGFDSVIFSSIGLIASGPEIMQKMNRWCICVLFHLLYVFPSRLVHSFSFISTYVLIICVSLWKWICQVPYHTDFKKHNRKQSWYFEIENFFNKGKRSSKVTYYLLVSLRYLVTYTDQIHQPSCICLLGQPHYILLPFSISCLRARKYL